MQALTDFYTALMARNWYAVCAFTIMIGTQIVRKNNLKIWLAIPSGYRFLWPVVAAMSAAFVHAFGLHETVRQALTDSLNAIWQIALPAMGGAAVLKESPLPWDGGPGGNHPPVPPLPPAPVPPVALVPPLTPLPSDDRPTPVDPTVAPPPSDPPRAA